MPDVTKPGAAQDLNLLRQYSTERTGGNSQDGSPHSSEQAGGSNRRGSRWDQGEEGEEVGSASAIASKCVEGKQWLMLFMCIYICLLSTSCWCLLPLAISCCCFLLPAAVGCCLLLLLVAAVTCLCNVCFLVAKNGARLVTSSSALPQ
jgi:hypothetical protein